MFGEGGGGGSGTVSYIKELWFPTYIVSYNKTKNCNCRCSRIICWRHFWFLLIIFVKINFSLSLVTIQLRRFSRTARKIHSVEGFMLPLVGEIQLSKLPYNLKINYFLSSIKNHFRCLLDSWSLDPDAPISSQINFLFVSLSLSLIHAFR